MSNYMTFQAEGVLSLPASVRLSVRPSVLSVRKLYLVRTITRHIFELESSNLHQTCILGYSRLVLKMEVIDLDLPGNFWPFWLRILGNSVCPLDSSSRIWASITKFAQNMHPGILSTGIENRGHSPWPSRSFRPFYFRILGNAACPRDNSSQIWARITKFARNMNPVILSAAIGNGGHWHWPSRSFRPFWLVCMITCNGFELESPNLHQICILGFSQLVLKMGVVDLDLQGHSAIILTQENSTVSLVYWSRPAKGCHTSQTCSCLKM